MLRSVAGRNARGCHTCRKPRDLGKTSQTWQRKHKIAAFSASKPPSRTGFGWFCGETPASGASADTPYLTKGRETPRFLRIFAAARLFRADLRFERPFKPRCGLARPH